MSLKDIHINITEIVDYPWINNSSFNILCYNNETTGKPRFMELVKLLLWNGFRQTKPELVSRELMVRLNFDNTYWINGDTNKCMDGVEISNGIIEASKWVANNKLSFNEKTKEFEALYKSYKDDINAFFNEIIDYINEGKQRVFYQSTSGMGL